MPMLESLKELHDAQRYNDLSAAYDSLTEEEESSLNEWDYVYLMNGLYKSGRYQDGLNLYKKFIEAFPNSNKLNDKMGWCVYHLYIKTHDFSKRDGDNQLLKKVDYTLKRIKDGMYSPVWRIVNLVTKGIMGRNQVGEDDYRRCSKFLDCVDYKSLSHDEHEFEHEGKRRKLASDYEVWFSRKTKCLEEAESFDECIHFCDEGLATINRFHSNNDSWFRYRKAYCLLALGKVAEANATAQQILSLNFKNWNAYHLMYDIAVAENDSVKAMQFAGCCALADPSHEMRVKFYKDYSDFLDVQGMSEEAMLHRQLIVLVKQEKEWTVKEEERQNISPEISAMSKADVLRRLRHFWEEHRDRGKAYISGKVDRLLSSGKDGFVRDEEGRTYYFRFSESKCKPELLKQGTPVMFVLEDRFDKKKKSLNKVAVDVRIL